MICPIMAILFDTPRMTSPAPAVQLDNQFANHAPLTLAHILPAMLFMVLGPLQFVRGLRAKYPQIHRWSGRIFLAASTVVGVTGLTMAFGKTIGGVDERPRSLCSELFS